jgi:hypothetical protein
MLSIWRSIVDLTIIYSWQNMVSIISIPSKHAAQIASSSGNYIMSGGWWGSYHIDSKRNQLLQFFIRQAQKPLQERGGRKNFVLNPGRWFKFLEETVGKSKPIVFARFSILANLISNYRNPNRTVLLRFVITCGLECHLLSWILGLYDLNWTPR